MLVHLRRNWFVGEGGQTFRYKKSGSPRIPTFIPDKYRDQLPKDARVADETAAVVAPVVQPTAADVLPQISVEKGDIERVNALTTQAEADQEQERIKRALETKARLAQEQAEPATPTVRRRGGVRRS